MTILSRIVRSLLASVAGGLLGFLCGLAGVGLAFAWGWKPHGYAGLAAYVICAFATILGAATGGLCVWLRRVGLFLGVAVPVGFAIWVCTVPIKADELAIFAGGLLGLLGAGALSGLAGRFIGVVGVRPAPDATEEAPLPLMAVVVEDAELITTARRSPPPGNLQFRKASEDAFS
jgi:hypothetical protein